MSAQPPRRVRVTSPRRDAARSRPARTPAREIDEQTGVGLVYLMTLVRTQRRLAAGLLGGLLVLLVGLPLGVRLLPRPGASDTGWIVATWVCIGVLAYPLMWAAARWFVRAADRLDDQFVAATAPGATTTATTTTTTSKAASDTVTGDAARAELPADPPGEPR